MDEQKQRGLGDTVAAITGAVGIQPCGGCKKRIVTWNKAVPYDSGVIGKVRELFGRWDGRPLRLKQVPGNPETGNPKAGA